MYKLNKKHNQIKTYKLKDKTQYLHEHSNKCLVFQLFQGVWAVFCDCKSYHQSNNLVDSKNIFRIDHCLTGMLEGVCTDGCCKYISENEFLLRLTQSNLSEIKFPFNDYRGMCIIVDLNSICDELSRILITLSINIKLIFKNLDLENYCYANNSNSNSKINEIFNEMYQIKDRNEVEYLKIKFIELLHLLLKISSNPKEKMTYFRGKYVNIIKKIRNKIVNNIGKPISLEKIVQYHGMNMNIFRGVFKKIYGETPYTYFKNYKIKFAALMISETKKNINEIAASVGYENASKFSQSFKKVMGINPLEYRNQHNEMIHY